MTGLDFETYREPFEQYFGTASCCRRRVSQPSFPSPHGAGGRRVTGWPELASTRTDAVYDLNWNVILNNWQSFVDGLFLGLKLAFFGLGIGTIIGLLVALRGPRACAPQRAGHGLRGNHPQRPTPAPALRPLLRCADFRPQTSRRDVARASSWMANNPRSWRWPSTPAPIWRRFFAPAFRPLDALS